MAISQFLKKPLTKHKSGEVIFPKATIDAFWQEDSKIANRKYFKTGARVGYNNVVTLSKYQNYKVNECFCFLWPENTLIVFEIIFLFLQQKLFIELDSFDEINHWIFGCTAVNSSQSVMWWVSYINALKRTLKVRFTLFVSLKLCFYKSAKGYSLSHNIQSIAAHDNFRSSVLLDIQHIQKYYPLWTQLMVRIPPTNKPVSSNTNSPLITINLVKKKIHCLDFKNIHSICGSYQGEL